jgi:hypothetical protein
MRMPLVDIRGLNFEHALAGGDLAAAKTQIEAAFVVEKTLHQEMITDFKSGTPGYPAVGCYLNSEQVMLACAVQAGKKVPKRHRPTLETLLGIPPKLTLKKPLGEIDWIRLEPKKHSKGKDFRFVHDFGPMHRTVKQMVLRVLECRFVPKPFQFLGIQKPIVQVRKAILDGKIHFATMDIENHFGSFRPKKLAALLPMLPKAWVDYVVCSRHVVMKWKKTSLLHNTHVLSPTELLYLARLGIPAGSICSPIIAAHSISMLHWASPVMLWNYADNFLLLAATAVELQEGIEELTAAVKGLPGGHFILKKVNQGHAEDGLDFLGHRLTLTGNKIETEPSLANEQSIIGEGRKMGQRVALALNKGDKAKAIHHAKKYCAQVKGWLAAFA